MEKVSVKRIVLAALSVSAALAQSESPHAVAPPVTAAPGGLQVQSVAGFVGYYSVAPEAVSFADSGSALRGDGAAGASATIAYTRLREGSYFSISYTPSYVARLRYSKWNTWEHSLTLNWNRKTPRWTFNASGVGVIGSLTDMLLSPTSASTLASAGGSAADLASAVLTGNSSNQQLANTVNGASTLESAAGAVIYGSRILTAAAEAGATYAWSGRLTLRANAGASRMQYWKEANLPAGAQSIYQVPFTDTGSAGVGLGYALSPRTQLGVDVASQRVYSRAQDAYNSSGTVSLGRVMSERWFLQAYAGGGVINPVRQTDYLPTGAQYLAGGKIGYKTYAHTFVATLDRVAGDAYGVGAAASISAGGAWTWNPPGASWWFTSEFREQRLSGIGVRIAPFRTLDSWRAGAGFGRRLSGHLAILAQYAYMSDSGLVSAAILPPDEHIARISFLWLARERAIR